MLSASRVLCRQAKVLMKKRMQGSDKSTCLRPHSLNLNFLTCVARRCYQDVRAWLTAALTAERITMAVIRGGHLGAAHDVQRE
jgi:hypothetical protein